MESLRSSWHFANDNGEIQVNYKGDVRGEKMKGVFVANFGGQERETPFEAVKVSSSKVDDDEVDDDDEDD